MAKNYSLKEAVQIIVENDNPALIMELGKRFPLLVSKITRIVVKSGEEFNDLMQYMPDNLSANKVNQSIRKEVGEPEDEDGFEDAGGDDQETAPVKKGPKTKRKDEFDENDTDYDNWNNAQLYKRLGELGKRKDCKEKYGDMSHDSMLKYLKKYHSGTPADESDEVEETEEATSPYDGMKAVELYKLCKERGIKTEKQLTAKYYVFLLKKADQDAADEAAKAKKEAAKKESPKKEADDDDWDDEGWDEDEGVKEAPEPKKEKRPVGRPPKGKKAEPKPKEADDDEDWDI